MLGKAEQDAKLPFLAVANSAFLSSLQHQCSQEPPTSLRKKGLDFREQHAVVRQLWACASVSFCLERVVLKACLGCPGDEQKQANHQG